MSEANTWLLPDGIADVLPKDAWARETTRRHMLDVLVAHGYKLVDPPLVEYTESLLNRASEDLKRQTFRIVDQLTGRLMGVRADITQQVARIDAQQPTDAVARYCYAAPVLHTRPKAVYASRTPFQIGAELYGHAGISADIELIDLLMKLLQTAGVYQQNNADDESRSPNKLHIDFGNVAIFTAMAKIAGLTDMQQQQVLNLYQRKAMPELKVYCDSLPQGDDFYYLGLHSQELDLLAQKLSVKMTAENSVMHAIYDLKRLNDHMKRKWPQCIASVDAAELASYHYHTGVVFKVFGICHDEQGETAIPFVQGGRYDGIGKNFTAPKQVNTPDFQPSERAATGFSCDLGKLLAFKFANTANTTHTDDVVIAAPALDDAELDALLEIERAKGHIIINKLSEKDGAGATHAFILQKKQWVLVELPIV